MTMKYFKIMSMVLCLMMAGVTLVSCGDDEESSITPPSSGTSYEQISVYVSISHNGTENPFRADNGNEDKIKADLTKLITDEILKIDGVKTNGEYLEYDYKKSEEKRSAIKAAMAKLEPTLQNQKINLSGTISCSVSAHFPDEQIWYKDFTYTTQSDNSFVDNGITYCTINDTEVGVVSNATGIKDPTYSGDIVIPETVKADGKTYTVTAIGPKAFYNSKITSVSLPKTLTTLYDGCFAYTHSLKAITIPAAVKEYKNTSSESDIKLFYSSGIQQVTVEEGVTTLCESMFDGMSELQKVVLPSTVTEIPKHCFARCSALTDFTAKGTITKVDEWAFYKTALKDMSGMKFKGATLATSAFNGCNGFTALEIPEGVTTIAASCFKLCESLTSITFPASVTKIDHRIFTSCAALKDINFKGATPATLVEETADGKAYNAFSDLDFTKGIKIYVPAASADAYRKAAVWSKYSEYIVGK